VKENHFLVEEIEQGRCFQTKNGKVYKREEKIRKRIRATDVDTGRVYLFSPIYEVMKVD
ncbi:MAG: hypothetical protein RL634_1400, partial [Bacteroidota bacterium]